MGTLRVLSHGSELFQDRHEAGKLLAAELSDLKGKRPVVLGIPRGGVVVAKEIASKLDGDLDIVLSRKLRTPGQEELAMGSVSEDGHIFLNQEVLRGSGITRAEIEREKESQMAEIRRRIDLFRSVRPKVPLKNRIVIVTDDGIATGATTQAAFWAVRAEHPRQLLAAIPVGPEDNVKRLAADVDELLCLRTPPMFYAVGQFYRQFRQVEDEDVLEILRLEGELVK
jgi:predicted phosphoribosyltransferase